MEEKKKLRNHDVKVLLAKDEKMKLKNKAEELGISLMAYIRMTSLNAKIKVEE